MTTKRDLIQAQKFGRRRLLTAFVSGMPGGRELEPTNPLRSVIAGIALSVLVVVAGFVMGWITKPLGNGWDNGSFIIAEDSGARYVSVSQKLYPVANASSALLLTGSAPLVTTEDKISSAERGSMIGIPDAADMVPAKENLITKDWSVCRVSLKDPNYVYSISIDPEGDKVSKSDRAILVQAQDYGSDDTDWYLVTGNRRYPIRDEELADIRRSLGIEDFQRHYYEATWLNLIPLGDRLEKFNAGDSQGSPLEPIAGHSIKVGTRIDVKTSSESIARYYVLSNNIVVPLSDFQSRLYEGPDDEVIDLRLTDIEGYDTDSSYHVSRSDWPTAVPQELSLTTQWPCFQMTAAKAGSDPIVQFATRTAPTTLPTDTTIDVASTHGALVRARTANNKGAGLVYLIDDSGRAFPIGGTVKTTIGLLQFDEKNIVEVYSSWIDLFPRGPELSQEAAIKTVNPADDDGPDVSVTQAPEEAGG